MEGRQLIRRDEKRTFNRKDKNAVVSFAKIEHAITKTKQSKYSFNPPCACSPKKSHPFSPIQCKDSVLCDFLFS